MRALPLSHRTGRARRLSWLVVAGLTTVALVAPSAASATPKDDEGNHKVTICHRTNSTTNPYVIITIDYSGADGGLVHDNGNGDHTGHLGPVFDWDNPPPPPHNEDQWGDIIPPFSWPGDNNHPGGSYPGLNWTEAGQIIYRADCGQPTTTTTSTSSTETTSTETTSDTTSTETTSTETTSIETISTETTSTDTTSTQTTTDQTTETTTDQTTETTTDQTTSTETTTDQTTSTEPTPTPTPSPTATPSPTPTPTPTQEDAPPPTGEVLSEVGGPSVTLPPTDTLPQGNSAPTGDNWRLILLAMAGILAGSLVLTPSEALARRKGR